MRSLMKDRDVDESHITFRCALFTYDPCIIPIKRTQPSRPIRNARNACDGPEVARRGLPMRPPGFYQTNPTRLAKRTRNEPNRRGRAATHATHAMGPTLLAAGYRCGRPVFTKRTQPPRPSRNARNARDACDGPVVARRWLPMRPPDFYGTNPTRVPNRTQITKLARLREDYLENAAGHAYAAIAACRIDLRPRRISDGAIIPQSFTRWCVTTFRVACVASAGATLWAPSVQPTGELPERIQPAHIVQHVSKTAKMATCATRWNR